jgi:hypothetical protein
MINLENMCQKPLIEPEVTSNLLMRLFDLEDFEYKHSFITHEIHKEVNGDINHYVVMYIYRTSKHEDAVEWRRWQLF